MQALGLVLSAAAVIATGAGPPTTGQALASVGAGAAGTAGLALLYRALATGTMSVVAPVAATGVALPLVVGVLTGDDLSAGQAVGLAAAVVGVLASSHRPDTEDARAAARTIGLAVLAAAGFGCYFIGSHAGVRGGLAWLLLLSHAVACVGVVGFAAVRRLPVVPARREWAPLTVIGLLDLSATALYGLANRDGLLSVVAVVGSLYPVATVILARLVLRERVSRVQAAGIGLALTGVVLIGAA